MEGGGPNIEELSNDIVRNAKSVRKFFYKRTIRKKAKVYPIASCNHSSYKTSVKKKV